MAKREWEEVNSRGHCGDTCRLRVPGGWLYRERECGNRDAYTTAIAMVFVPDRDVRRLADEPIPLMTMRPTTQSGD